LNLLRSLFGRRFHAKHYSTKRAQMKHRFAHETPVFRAAYLREVLALACGAGGSVKPCAWAREESPIKRPSPRERAAD